MIDKSKRPSETVRKKYSPKFKGQALERAEKEGVSQTDKDLGIAESMLYFWRAKQRQMGQPLEQQKLQQDEFARLKRENARLAEENAFLKKVAVAFFANESN